MNTGNSKMTTRRMGKMAGGSRMLQSCFFFVWLVVEARKGMTVDLCIICVCVCANGICHFNKSFCVC
jgi:hypothetical protein